MRERFMRDSFPSLKDTDNWGRNPGRLWPLVPPFELAKCCSISLHIKKIINQNENQSNIEPKACLDWEMRWHRFMDFLMVLKCWQNILIYHAVEKINQMFDSFCFWERCSMFWLLSYTNIFILILGSGQHALCCPLGSVPAYNLNHINEVLPTYISLVFRKQLYIQL